MLWVAKNGQSARQFVLKWTRGPYAPDMTMAAALSQWAIVSRVRYRPLKAWSLLTPSIEITGSSSSYGSVVFWTKATYFWYSPILK